MTEKQIKDERLLTPEEKWERATIANNFIFYKVMRHNPDVCKELLEILLEIEIDRLEMRGEEVIETDFGSKGIRLDIYAKNEKDAYNIELQSTDTKELPERARYYQGTIDVDCLKSGQTYKELKNSYVIFICIPDIFQKGLPCYSFENLCLENPELRLNDRAYKIFYIADNYDKILNEKQKEFLKLVAGQKAGDNFSKKVARLAEDAKRNTQWKKQYMEWERQRAYDFESGKEAGIAIGKEAGISLGSQQKAIEAAKSFFANGASIELISKSLNMTPEQVNEVVTKR